MKTRTQTLLFPEQSMIEIVMGCGPTPTTVPAGGDCVRLNGPQVLLMHPEFVRNERLGT